MPQGRQAQVSNFDDARGTVHKDVVTLKVPVDDRRVVAMLRGQDRK